MMTEHELRKYFPHATESTIRRNTGAVGRISSQGAKPIDRSESNHRQLESRPESVEVRCELTAYRRRLLDEHENHPYSFKRLVDAIAADLGVPDNDPRLVWRFYQVKTDGEEGTAIRIRIQSSSLWHKTAPPVTAKK